LCCIDSFSFAVPASQCGHTAARVTRKWQRPALRQASAYDFDFEFELKILGTPFRPKGEVAKLYLMSYCKPF
jgi:hypothetical protein